MRTAQLIDGKIELKEMSKPSLDNRSGAIIKVLGCGLCGSDIVKFRHNSVAEGTVYYKYDALNRIIREDNLGLNQTILYLLIIQMPKVILHL